MQKFPETVQKTSLKRFYKKRKVSDKTEPESDDEKGVKEHHGDEWITLDYEK